MTPQEHNNLPLLGQSPDTTGEKPADYPSVGASNQFTGESVAPNSGLSAQVPAFPPGIASQYGRGAAPVSDSRVAQATGGSSAFPQIADDNDLIEKEWVQSAKKIVARTSNDPHLQNEAISTFKADYLKKRFNKDVKLSEGA